MAVFGAEGTTPLSFVHLDSSTKRFSSSGSIRELIACGRGTVRAIKHPRSGKKSSGSSVVGRSARRQRPFGLGRLFLSFFLVGRLVSRRDLFMNAWTPHAHGLLGAVVVVVATLFQGVGVEAPRAAALRRRAAEAPLVMSRQALSSAERAARAAHH